MNQPEVTVCIPVHNAAAFITDTLESIRAQSYQNLRVLISVDKSDDHSADICKSFFDVGDKSHVYVQETRLNYVGNINYLLRKVRSEYLCVMPHDDTIEPAYFETLVAHMEAHQSAIVAYGDINRIGLMQAPMVQPAVVGPKVHRIIEFLHEHNTAAAFRGVVRVDMLPADFALPENRWQGFASDTAWLLKLACIGELHRLDHVLYNKRIREDSVVRRWLAEGAEWHRQAWLEHCRACERICRSQHLSKADARLVSRALVARLTMAKRNLWPASGIYDMTEIEKQELIDRFQIGVAE